MPAAPPYAEGMSSDLRRRTTTLRGRITATITAGVTERPAPRSPRLRRGRLDLVFAADVLTAIICWAVTWGVLAHENTQHHAPHNPGLLFLLAVVTCAPLVLRTSYPLTAWSVSTLALLWAAVVVAPYSVSGVVSLPAAIVVYVLCLYAVAVRCRPWVVVVAALVTVFGAISIDGQPTTTAVIVAVLPVSVGVIVRIRRGNREELEVAERRHEDERALLQERQRIARELHDVVSHTMATINVQAGVAAHVLPTRPEVAAEAVAAIRTASKEGLQELRAILNVLRQADDADPTQPARAPRSSARWSRAPARPAWTRRSP